MVDCCSLPLFLTTISVSIQTVFDEFPKGLFFLFLWHFLTFLLEGETVLPDYPFLLSAVQCLCRKGLRSLPILITAVYQRSLSSSSLQDTTYTNPTQLRLSLPTIPAGSFFFFFLRNISLSTSYRQYARP
jgi:hypothetical protein